MIFMIKCVGFVAAMGERANPHRNNDKNNNNEMIKRKSNEINMGLFERNEYAIQMIVHIDSNMLYHN